MSLKVRKLPPEEASLYFPTLVLRRRVRWPRSPWLSLAEACDGCARRARYRRVVRLGRLGTRTTVNLCERCYGFADIEAQVNYRLGLDAPPRLPASKLMPRRWQRAPMPTSGDLRDIVAWQLGVHVTLLVGWTECELAELAGVVS